MVLVTNIYGEAAQLEETVCRDSQCNQAAVSSHRCWACGVGGRGVEVGGGVRLTLDWLRWCTIHGIFRDPGDEFEPQLLRVTEARIRIPSNNPY